MFWLLLFFATGGLSILALNPVPIIACAILWALMRPVEEAAAAEGANMNRPTPPTSGVGTASCLVWFLFMGGVLLMLFLVVGVMITGGV